MVEIYRPDRFRSLSGCSLVAADGSFRVDFHSSFDKVKKAYVAIKHKDTLDVDFNSYRRMWYFVDARFQTEWRGCCGMDLSRFPGRLCRLG